MIARLDRSETNVSHERTSRTMTPAVQANRLRLLIVTPRYFPYMGGVENHVYQVAHRLARAGVDVTVLSTDPTGELAPRENADGVTVRRVHAWPSERDYYFAPDIYRIITQEFWDLVHVQSYHTLVAPVAMLAALRAGIPYVLTFHGGGHSSWARNALRGLHRRLLRPLFTRAARLVATARFEIALFGEQLGIPRDKFVLIPNGSDLSGRAQQVSPSTDPELVVSIGRLERYKGHHRVIAALPKVLAQRPETRLWIAGKGPYEPELRGLARDLGVADHVEIRAIPATERERLAQELSKAALVVLLSEYETNPMAALEAIALGRPTLVADTSGLSELAEQGWARAIPLESTPDQVAEEVLAQLEDPHRPEGVELSTWDECATDLLAVYKSVVRRSSCAS